MIKISDKITLHPVTVYDQAKLYQLMKEIYTPVYEHLWKDDGSWYLNSLYKPNNVEKELSQNDSLYYFIHCESETIGIYRLLENTPLANYELDKSAKLHRIYLHPKSLGQGIGKLIMNWTDQYLIKNKHTRIWLEAMDSQHDAINFYKKLGFQIDGNFRLDFEIMHDHYKGMLIMSKSLI